MLRTPDLQCMARREPLTASQFEGVFAADQIPKRVRSYPAGMIINTDPSHLPGEHWLALYFPSAKEVEFFDSYGFPPVVYGDHFAKALKDKQVTRNRKSLQSANSNVCGYYCLFFLYHKARGKTIPQIEKVFRNEDRVGNDRLVVQFVRTHFINKPLFNQLPNELQQCSIVKKHALRSIFKGRL